MNRFIIVDGLPYLYANGKARAVRWDAAGFTVGTVVELAAVPAVTYSELSIKAKCVGHLDSIRAGEQATPEAAPEATEQATPEAAPAPKKASRTRKKAAGDAK